MIAALLWMALQAPAVDVAALVKKEFYDDERMIGAKVPETFQALGAGPGAWIADVGAGPGFHTVLLAQVVGPDGRVLAVDVDEKVTEKLREKIEKRKFSNVEAILGVADDPKLPTARLDGALIVDSYHEMPQYEAMLRRIREALKPGGRLVILDQFPSKTLRRPRSSQVKNHKISPDLAEQELRAAGFEIRERQDAFIDNPDVEGTTWMIVARRP
ncbi:MAG: methyltransferase domain-containing protein [Acidobacteria bacterium]|nr:methyltransferase domain-containing protein [Acidobacteriota bacterium]